MDSIDNNSVAPPNPTSVITNCTVSGLLPKFEAFAINYPGYPSSTSRAIHTLGGLDEISKVRSSGSSQLELRFRPDDPYCHPAFAECRPFAGLLLKISKTRPESDNNEGTLNADVVARVNQAYHFEGMVDYQYVLPVHAAEVRRKKRRCVFDEETDLEKETDVMMLVPSLFSPKDKPEELVLNPPANLFSKSMQRGVVEHRWEMDIKPCLAIAFNIEKIPEKIYWEDKIPRDSEEWEIQLHVSKLFEERPVWPRRSIHDHLLDNGLQVTGHQLRRFLFRSGYYFSTGPFGRFWIRKGYDPRKDPESRIYQRIDFRVPLHLRNAVDANIVNESKQTWKDVCQFKMFPWKNFTCLQFLELADDYIQDAIRKPTYQTTCMPSRGWFSDNLLRALRLRVSIRFLSICPVEGAQAVLRSTCEEFERLKKLEAHSRYRKPSAEQLNRDPEKSSENGCGTSDDTEHQLLSKNDSNNYEIENEEEEEEEEQEEEEEMDAYKSPAAEVEEGCFSLEPSSDQVSANSYLQDLLCGFPISKNGEEFSSNKNDQDADLSDGEYQIYEQDSAGSDDDDDF